MSQTNTLATTLRGPLSHFYEMSIQFFTAEFWYKIRNFEATNENGIHTWQPNQLARLLLFTTITKKKKLIFHAIPSFSLSRYHRKVINILHNFSVFLITWLMIAKKTDFGINLVTTILFDTIHMHMHVYCI